MHHLQVIYVRLLKKSLSIVMCDMDDTSLWNRNETRIPYMHYTFLYAYCKCDNSKDECR